MPDVFYEVKVHKEFPKFFKINCEDAIYPLNMNLYYSKGEYEIYVSWKYRAPTYQYKETLLVAEQNDTHFEIYPPDDQKNRYLRKLRNHHIHLA